MLDRRIIGLLKIIFPVIFVSYFCSITFFTHTHIVNGVTIVHSHPYKQDSNGDPAHEHQGAQIQLIDVLSSFFSTGNIIFSVILSAVLSGVVVLLHILYVSYLNAPLKGLSTLRPPPFAL